MTLTYGFYNSVSSDRVYDALQMGQLFDGLIYDGVYEAFGDHLEVTEDSGMDILVGSGRAWFNHTWTYNDTGLSLTVSTADALLPRIDIVYIEINLDTGVRANDIDIMEGTPASSPVPPTLTQSGNLWQYPLAQIYVGAGVTSISDSNITNLMGTASCPYVTGPISGNIIDHDHTSGQGGAIDTEGLANAAITESKLDTSAVTEDKLGTGAVTNTKIGSGAVTEIKLGTGAVTNTKLGSSSVSESKIQSNAVTLAKMASNSVDKTKIVDRTRYLQIPIHSMDAPDSQNPGIAFPDSVTTRLHGGFIVPEDWVSGNIITMIGRLTQINTVIINYGFYYGNYSLNEAWNTHSKVNSTMPLNLEVSANQLVEISIGINLTSLAAGDACSFWLEREGGHGADYSTGTLYILAMLLEYTADS